MKKKEKERKRKHNTSLLKSLVYLGTFKHRLFTTPDGTLRKKKKK